MIPCRSTSTRLPTPGSASDDVKSLIFALKLIVKLYLHVVELDLYAVKQGIVICSSRCYLVERVYHLNDSVQDSLWKHQA